MVRIRLSRIGGHKNPFYRLIVADQRAARNTGIIEEIGTYDPLAKNDGLKVNAEAAKKWIANGAQPTDTVKALLKKAGAIE